MAMWRCPHCATPQAEAARCWVCHRSSTCCATCRDFRRSVAGGLGFCGLDARRSPLQGDELRGCWRAAAERVEASVSPPSEARTSVRNRREFVSLEPAMEGLASTGPAAGPGAGATPAAPVAPRTGWSLFPELEA